MSDDLDGLLRASVHADAPDWLEQLVTERAVALVEGESSSFGAMTSQAVSRVSRRWRGAGAAIARVRQRMNRRSLGGGLWARIRALLPRPDALG
jgi:hypothetical protein